MNSSGGNTGDDMEGHDMDALRGAFGEVADPTIKEGLRETLEGFREQLKSHPYVQKLDRHREHLAREGLSRPVLGLLSAGGAVLVCLVAFAFLMLWAPTPTWAEITERFRSTPFFDAVIYVKEDATSEPRQLELWMGRSGRARLRVGTQVIFAQPGEISRAYDIGRAQEASANGMGTQLLQMLGPSPEFSLETVIRTVSGGRLEDISPVVNPSAIIHEDLVVFDMGSRNSPEWLRIWALRESKLPVRVRVWDPRNGASVDAIFTYSTEQDDAFFDPESFGTALHGAAQRRPNLAYAFLKDAGGRPVTPQQLFEQTSGYHLPVVEQAGITEMGAIWVVATKSRNRTPTGRIFDGFGQLEDDLGREYLRCYAMHTVRGDRSLDIFVPVDYPFDQRVPSKLTLTCRVEELDPRKQSEVIGTVELDELRKGAPWPADLDPRGGAEVLPYSSVAERLIGRKDWEQLERLIDTVPGRPEESSLAYSRELWRMSMHCKREEFEKASAVGEALMPVMVERYTTWQGSSTSPSVFNTYIVALAACGRIESAASVLRQVASLEPEIPSHLNRRAQEKIRSRNKANFDSFLLLLERDLTVGVKLSAEETDRILKAAVQRR